MLGKPKSLEYFSSLLYYCFLYYCPYKGSLTTIVLDTLSKAGFL